MVLGQGCLPTPRLGLLEGRAYLWATPSAPVYLPLSPLAGRWSFSVPVHVYGLAFFLPSSLSVFFTYLSPSVLHSFISQTLGVCCVLAI